MKTIIRPFACILIALSAISISAQTLVIGGTTSVNSASMKLTAGTYLTSLEAGALEYDGSQLLFNDKNINRKMPLSDLSNSATLNFPTIGSASSAELNISVLGAVAGDTCNCAPLGSIENNIKWSCYVNISNTATIRLSNLSTASINPANKSWMVKIIK